MRSGLISFSVAALLVSACAPDQSQSEESDGSEKVQTETSAPAALSAEVQAYKSSNEAYIAALPAADGWTTLPTGVKYRIVERGNGPIADSSQFVEVNLTLRLVDGTTVFTSEQLGENTIFPANGVMRGWADAMREMPEGSHWEIAIPAERAYQDQERPDIPPYSSLLFDVQLVDVMTPAEMQAKRAAKLEVFAEEQRAYIEENAKKPGIFVTESGLQYEILESGPADGLLPVKTSKVEVEYRGLFTDGREFDSSFKRGKSSFFHPTQVVPGWEEAMLLMRPGDKWRLTLPAHLGYGVAGFGDRVSPHANLIFEVKVVEVYNGAKGIPSREWMKIQAEKAAAEASDGR